MYKPTLRQLEYFNSVARTLSFSQAALECNVGQSTLSNAIKDLETGLQFSLFDRTSRKVFLTAQGKSFLEQVKPVLDSQDNLLTRVEQIQSPDNRHIRLGVIPTIAPFLLPKLLNGDHTLSIKEGLSEDILAALDDRSIDVALIALPFPLQTHFKSITLYDDPLILAYRKGDDIEKQPYIFLEDGHCLTDQAVASCNIAKTNISSQFQGTSLHTIMALVQNGFGQTLIPEMSLPIFKSMENIDFTKFTSKHPSRQIALVWTLHKHKAHVEYLNNILLNI